MSEINKEENSKAFYELQGLRNQKEKIEASYREIFPKVDPYLVHDLLLRMYEDPQKIRSKDQCIL